MAARSPACQYASLSTPMVVWNLITSPPEIPLPQAARARGCSAGNRFCMRLHQGALAFEPWTGKPASVQAMRDAPGI
ncbi:MAG: hypothetical protein HY766_08245 [candidate division NC10 bacterium]|nr:hypothetical protein [candidate division NC10 bacterium]